MELLKRHADLLLPVAAAFLFLPQLLFAWHMGDTLPNQWFKGDRLFGDGLMLAIFAIPSLLAQLVISSVVMHDGTAGRTLGGVLQAAALLLLPAMAVTLIQGLAIGFGLIFLILPGLWMLARLAPAMPLLATSQRDPIAALRDAWRLTSGRALPIFGMQAILFTGFVMIALGITGLGAALGVLSTLAAGQPAQGWGIGRWLFEAMSAGASALFAMGYIAFLTVLTRALQAVRQEQG